MEKQHDSKIQMGRLLRVPQNENILLFGLRLQGQTSSPQHSQECTCWPDGRIKVLHLLFVLPWNWDGKKNERICDAT